MPSEKELINSPSGTGSESPGFIPPAANAASASKAGKTFVKNSGPRVVTPTEDTQNIPPFQRISRSPFRVFSATSKPRPFCARVR